MVSRLIWVQETVGSNPAVRTRKTGLFRQAGFSTKSTLLGQIVFDRVEYIGKWDIKLTEEDILGIIYAFYQSFQEAKP